MVERIAVNDDVVGSSPTSGAIFCQHSSVVEQGFCKAQVVSSILTVGSTFYR